MSCHLCNLTDPEMQHDIQDMVEKTMFVWKKKKKNSVSCESEHDS